MQTRERHISKPEADAVKRAAVAEAAVARHREEAARLARDLAEMREDRDRWRAQAERLAVALERIKQPVPMPAPAPIAASDPRREESADSDLLYGATKIADFLGITPRQARHRIDSGEIPTFRIGESICARRSTLTAWLAQRETAAMGAQ